MSTSAGMVFKIDTIKNPRRTLNKICKEVDEITNANGFGVACTPWIYKDGNRWCISAQTHWDYENKNGNGSTFLKELRKVISRHSISKHIRVLRTFTY